MFIKKEFNQKEKEEMLKMYNEDKMSLQKIADKKGICISVVHRVLKELNYIPRTNREQALKYTFDENYFENIDSEHKAYWLGYICADATIYEKTNTDSGILKIEMKKDDQEIAEKIKLDLKSNHPIKYYGNKYYPTYQCARVVFKSNKLIQDLHKYGIGAKKSLTIQFPIQLIDNNYVGAFIRGYFDGDGSISLPTQHRSLDVRILGTKQFLETIKEICKIDCTISKPKGAIHELRITATEMKIKFLTFIYKDATLYLQRKFDKVQIFLNKH